MASKNGRYDNSLRMYWQRINPWNWLRSGGFGMTSGVGRMKDRGNHQYH